MKINFTYSILFILLISTLACKKSIDRLYLSDMGISQPMRIYMSDLDNDLDKLRDSIVSSNNENILNYSKHIYAIPDQGMPCHISAQDTIPKIADPMTLKVKVYYDGSTLSTTEIDINADIVNAVLGKLNMGLQIDIVSTKSVPLYEIETDGRINADNIVAELKSHGAFDSRYDYQVYLFDQSDFFNTANAITINYGGQQLIMGDGYLLSEPMLFAHELGHAMGLTHNNALLKGDRISSASWERQNMFNVMHESNIGCVRGITARQLLLMHSGEYVKETENEIYYPINSVDCNCELGQDHILTDKVQMYINSFDRNIHDSPLIGDHNSFILHILEAVNPVNTNKAMAAIEANYQNEFDIYIKDSGLISKSDYVADRLETQRRLRSNNTIRWLAENMRATSVHDSIANYVHIKKNFNTINFDSMYVIGSLNILAREQEEHCGGTYLRCTNTDIPKDGVGDQNQPNDFANYCESIIQLRSSLTDNIKELVHQNKDNDFKESGMRQSKGAINDSGVIEFFKGGRRIN